MEIKTEDTLNDINLSEGGQVSGQNPSDIKEVINIIDDEYERLFDFNTARLYLKDLIDQWGTERTQTSVRRKIRKIEVDIDEERRLGKIGQDETFIPVRVIDTNIKREQPPFVNYLKQSRRLAVFKDPLDPSFVTAKLEEAFTDGICYENWEKDFFKTLDGSQSHGWDSLEVVYDETKPFRLCYEHIGHERLIFPLDALNLQDCTRVMREYDVTLNKLKSFIKHHNFNPEQVNKILDARKNRKDSSTVKIYKEYFKYDEVVYVAWCSFEDGVDDWLRAPVKLFLGIRHQEPRTIMNTQMDPMTGMSVQVPVTTMEWANSDIKLYPIFLLPYSETEEDKIFDYKGRVFYDEYKQEAQTSVTTGYVNGVNRAANVYAAIDGDDPGGNMQVLQDLQGNQILSRPLNFFHTDYPDPSVISGLQYLEAQNAQETNQVAWAVNNRKDSRKTAREISAAQEQSAQLDSVQLTLFSTFVRQVVTFSWYVVQSLALQGQIIVVATLDPATGSIVNDPVFINRKYIVKAGGDVDVVERGEKLAQMLNMWPIIAGTPIAPVYLINILKIAFPDDAAMYEKMLQIDNVKGQLLNSLYQILTVVQDDIRNMVPPEMQKNFDTLMQQVGQVVSGDQGQETTNKPAETPQTEAVK